MPAKHTLNVSLTEPLRDFVDAQVGSGRFQTGSEVVRAALRLLQDTLPDPVKEHGQEPADDADGIRLAKVKREPRPAKAHPVAP